MIQVFICVDSMYYVVATISYGIAHISPWNLYYNRFAALEHYIMALTSLAIDCQT
jgi:hypothetical protein